MNSNAMIVTMAMTATEISRYAGANTPGSGPGTGAGVTGSPAVFRSASPVVLIDPSVGKSDRPAVCGFPAVRPTGPHPLWCNNPRDERDAGAPHLAVPGAMLLVHVGRTARRGPPLRVLGVRERVGRSGGLDTGRLAGRGPRSGPGGARSRGIAAETVRDRTGAAHGSVGGCRSRCRVEHGVGYPLG